MRQYCHIDAKFDTKQGFKAFSPEPTQNSTQKRRKEWEPSLKGTASSEKAGIDTKSAKIDTK